jgi:TPP-dependent trihydroxycyclohexane-1,2-dione (THcHDO) dehydratase
MGYGLPAGLAAAAVDRQRAVISFAGDGCLLMSGSELATAVQFGLRVIVVSTALDHEGPTLIEIQTEPAQLTPDLRLAIGQGDG